MYTSRPPARPWVNAIAFALILAGAVFAYLLYRLHRFAKASEGSVNPVVLTGADIALLGGGALASWIIAGVLLRWQRRRDRAGDADS
ncbi:MAG TPA: hypothetical protein VK098_02775 [Beutenbergiaceae bacterium]|nr:hypothetical protein [Beutenbergiaceae bacterium]